MVPGLGVGAGRRRPVPQVRALLLDADLGVGNPQYRRLQTMEPNPPRKHISKAQLADVSKDNATCRKRQFPGRLPCSQLTDQRVQLRAALLKRRRRGQR